MSDQEAPLTSLCSICYANPPKYVCPRDHVKTCSLPCYKRHQQRADCNGQRDPTAYVKREQLATASGIDHDYNFLSGVERVFDKADRTREARGIGEPDQSTRKRWHDQGALQRYLRQHNILVDRAPVGMSRQKANQSRFIQKSKKVIWTVEWVDSSGSKRLSEAHEATTLGEAYAAMLADKERESKKRKRGTSTEPSSKNKKPDTTPSQDALPASRHNGESKDQSGSFEASKMENADEASSLPEAASPGEANANEDPSQEPLGDSKPSGAPEIQPDDHSASQTSVDPQPDSDTRSLILSRIQSEQSRQAALRNAKLPTGPPFFYLLRPHTISTSRVLIPLFAENTITASLADQTVLEFPTVHVLDRGQKELPEGYTTEDEYLKAKQEEDQEVEEFLRKVPGSAAGDYDKRGGGDGHRGAGGSELDPSKILEMLRRDVPN